jgi:hypothetical protein
MSFSADQIEQFVDNLIKLREIHSPEEINSMEQFNEFKTKPLYLRFFSKFKSPRSVFIMAFLVTSGITVINDKSIIALFIEIIVK